MLYIFVGVLFSLAYHGLANQDQNEQLANLALDGLQRAEWYLDRDVTVADSPVHFVEIDHALYKSWGEPLITPRRGLAKLLDYLAASNASVIVLDVLLEKPDCCDSEGDALLLASLRRIAAGPPGVRVILPVSVGADGDRKPNIADALIDADAEGLGSRFFRAFPGGVATAKDAVTRYWDSYRVAKRPDGTQELLWGVPLLAVMLAEGEADALQTAGTALLGPEGAHDLILSLGGRPLRIPGRSPDQKPDLYSQRIRYKLFPSTPPRFEGNVLLVNHPASDILGGQAYNGDESLGGKIVVVGNSSPDAGDIRQTVIGQMPGMYIVGNAIQALSQYEQPWYVAWWQSMLLETLVIVSAAVFITRHSGHKVNTVVSITFFVVSVPVCWYLYRRFGVFFNFLGPVAGMGVFIKLHDLVKKHIIKRYLKETGGYHA